jgi:1,4-alpha-glucan branching enzyme
MATATVLEQPLRQVVFRFDGRETAGARSVALVASFNRWDPAANPMQREDDGSWSAAVWLPPGEYDYLFLVDDVPWNDPFDDGRRACEWGGEYSLRLV